ncbi:MAG TPA: cytochrome c biogenesis protein CcsA [Sunxiuqinia sp.]|nr:cytochrome c biogenesis protein CcsA [Sunxiuqinia sp.]
MKKIFSFLVSTSFMGFLLLVFAFSMAVATFIESSYGTPAAKALVYNATWFEVLFLLMGINLLYNYVRYRQYTKKKFTMGLFHLAFIVIVIGAAITRFISYEGVMHIREGNSSNFIVSSDSYFSVEADGQKKEKRVLFSELSTHQFDKKLKIEGKSVDFKSVGFIEGAVRKPVESNAGQPIVDFVVSAGRGMQSFTFTKGQAVDMGPASIGFDDSSNIRFEQDSDKLYIVTDRPMEIRSMTGGTPVQLKAGSRTEVQTMHLYAFDNYLMLIKKFYPSAVVQVAKDESGKSNEDAVIVQVSDGQKKATINVFGKAGQIGDATTYMVGNTPVKLIYGSSPIYLPFSLKLRDFQLERYVGSMSPSSFASEITLVDPEKNVQRDVRIFMNNTLNYRGYRFYQSSYDQDELGTVLSVNKDFWGTSITYFGYLLLAIGMFASLFNKNSYFQYKVRHLKEISKSTIAILVFGVLLVGSAAQAKAQDSKVIPTLDNQLVQDFSELWVHKRDGRIEPMNTLSNEVLRKLSRKSSLNGMSADEVVLSMNLHPEKWRSVPFLKVDPKIAAALGITTKYAKVMDLFDENGQYRIADKVKTAYAKAPALRNMTDKGYIDLDERINICFMIFKGSLFTFFPATNTTKPWWSVGSSPTDYPTTDSLFVNRCFNLLAESLKPGSEIKPRQIMATISTVQQKFGAQILPSEQKKSIEMFYNKFQPFKRVFPWYLLMGFTLLLILFINIFRQRPVSKLIRYGFTGLILLGFLVHTSGLILRWYIAGHAPWSNGYESMVYVAWAIMLSGFIFGRKYPMVLGMGAFLSGITLFVAHLSWMNPSITHLVPVLKSYWLLIHVAVITASYGFIGLSAFVGVLVLILYIIMKDENRKTVEHFIDQMTTISELAATVGLYMLTIGTFLGGVWANESWGRYWGWDPKETWALISAVIYAFIVHMRLIPSLKGRYTYSVATVVGFTSILMTYFGVNYFLSGMHSYGKGSVSGIHWSVFVAAGVIFILIIWAYFKHKKYDDNQLIES